MDKSATTLLKALETRHLGDVFVAECKNGPTHTASHRRLDAWVLLKTWSPVTTIGYEIKVDRGDWVRDQKIGEYQGLCHLFYLVAPKGVVSAAELPDGVGLLEPVGTGARLLARRKAARREITMPVDLMTYVLMCRVVVQRPHPFDHHPGQWKVDELKRWLAEKSERRSLSYALGQKIRTQFEDQENALRTLGQRVKALEHIEQRIVELGFDPAQVVNSWRVEERIQQLGVIITPWLLSSLQQLEKELGRAREKLADLGKQSERLSAPSAPRTGTV